MGLSISTIIENLSKIFPTCLFLKKESSELSEIEIDEIFDMIDVDKSGAISRSEARLAYKLLSKRFGIKDVNQWMRKTDKNLDGKLNKKEFYQSVIDFD